MKNILEELQTLSDRFKLLSEKSMKESEAANSARKWVKGDLKERESETWLEALRMTKEILMQVPPPAESKYAASGICPNCGENCAGA